MSAPGRPPSEQGTVYVVVESEWQSGDVGGSLLCDSGEVLWDHLSSHIEWLKRDLTCGFTDRRVELERRYPNGYEVVVARRDEDIPPEVIERNVSWGSSDNAPSRDDGGVPQ